MNLVLIAISSNIESTMKIEPSMSCNRKAVSISRSRYPGFS